MQEKFYSATAAQLNILLNSVLILEEEPDNRALIDELMRIAHSLKGSSRLMEYRLLEHHFHILEDRFTTYAKGRIEPVSVFVDEVLATGRRIQFILDHLHMDFSEDEITTTLEQKLKDSSAVIFDPREVYSAGPSRVQVGIAKLDTLNKLLGELMIKQVSVEYYVRELEKLESESTQWQEAMRASLSRFIGKIDAASSSRAAADEFIEKASSCDNTMRVISENRKKIWRNLRSLPARMKELLEIARNNVLHSRMTPVVQAFENIPRLVRDLTKSQGKKVKLTIDGGETLLDKYILDGISTVLLHIIRNAIDHGIESPEQRVAEGKSDSGRIYIQALSKGEKVIIRVEDDGQGIDDEKLKARLKERGLLSEADAQNLSARELHQFLFKQGITTKDEISEISGRGVGMDVVRDTLERLKGSIRIQSARGLGTIFEIEVPLTLSIMQAVPVVVRGETYFIPLFNFERVVKTAPGDLKKSKGIFIFHREDDMPVVPLTRITGSEKSSSADEGDGPVVAVLRSVEKRWGIIVDEAFPKREIVVKDLGTFLRRVKHILGATITGEGKIILILDVPSIFRTLETKTIARDCIKGGCK